MKILFWQLNIINEPGIERAFRTMNIDLVIHKNILDDWDYDKNCPIIFNHPDLIVYLL